LNEIIKLLPYENVKRLEQICDFVKLHQSKSKITKILDVGCGMGELFTLPLVSLLQKEKVQIKAIDIDIKTINRANKNIAFFGLKHICFEKLNVKSEKNKYDFVVNMAVLEHVKNWKLFVKNLSLRVKSGGYLVIFIPNGLGPYEVESYIYRKLKLNRLVEILRKYKHKTKSNKRSKFILKETENDKNNVHINFFRKKQIDDLVLKHNFKKECVIKGVFLSGPISGYFLKWKFMRDLNNLVGQILPSSLISGWTLIYKKK